MDQFKTPKFKKLQSKWYGKLKDKGFEDIEQDETRLKKWSETFFKKGNLNQSNISVVEAKYNYYSMCRQFLGEYKFKNKSERKMFEMHSEGLGVRVIAVELKTYRRKVHETVQRLVRIMRGK